MKHSNIIALTENDLDAVSGGTLTFGNGTTGGYGSNGAFARGSASWTNSSGSFSTSVSFNFDGGSGFNKVSFTWRF
ncbi:MAG: hypothetical protein LCH38_13745 [Proteobacteria bacterium]|nr:hypothetical protein [Pseudomonadota bacterium]